MLLSIADIRRCCQLPRIVCFIFFYQVDELRQKLEQKNKLIEKKTQEALLVGFEIFLFSFSLC